MRHLFLSLLLFTSCAHTRSTPPSFGFFAIQCIETREVMCVLDGDMAQAECDSYVRPAIEKINTATGRPLFHYAGVVESEHPEYLNKLLDQGVYLIMGVAPENLPSGVLGMTRPQGLDLRHPECITRVATAINRLTWWEPYVGAVVLHEMLHALGAGHGDDGSALRTIMTPRAQAPAWVDHLSFFDLAALRAAYGN